MADQRSEVGPLERSGKRTNTVSPYYLESYCLFSLSQNANELG